MEQDQSLERISEDGQVNWDLDHFKYISENDRRNLIQQAAEEWNANILYFVLNRDLNISGLWDRESIFHFICEGWQKFQIDQPLTYTHCLQFDKCLNWVLNRNCPISLATSPVFCDLFKYWDGNTIPVSLKSRWIRLFLEFGAQVNFTQDSEMASPLHLAVALDEPEITEILLENGACVNGTDIYGQTPLFRAKDVETIEMLLRYGAQVNAQDLIGNTALHLICDKIPVVDDLRSIAEYLIRNGADVNLLNSRKRSALFVSLCDCISLLFTLNLSGNIMEW